MTSNRQSREGHGGGAIALHPRRGLPGFRKRVSLGVLNNAVVVTDRRGRRQEFPLDGSDRAPTAIFIFDILQEGLVDGAGRLLAIWPNGIWDTQEFTELIAVTNLRWGMDDRMPLPALRSDGLRMFDWPTLTMMRTSSGVGVVGFAALQLHFLPKNIAETLLTGGFVASVASFFLHLKATRYGSGTERHQHAAEQALADAPRYDDEDE